MNPKDLAMNAVTFRATPIATNGAIRSALSRLRREAQAFQKGIGRESTRHRKISNGFTVPGKGLCVEIVFTVKF